MKHIVRFSLGAILVLVVIAFTSKKQHDQYVEDLVIDIEVEEGNYFIDKQEVVELLNTSQADYILSQPVEKLDFKDLEKILEEHSFIGEAQIYRDVTGILEVNIKQARPVARLLFSDGSGAYIDETGKVLPLNTKHTARVLMVEITDKMNVISEVSELKQGRELMQVIDFINSSEFWSAQIAQIVLGKDRDVTMLPQVTKQEIRFGELNDIEEKFRKLELFYTRILPHKGWNTYAFVDVKYKNQIVCE